MYGRFLNDTSMPYIGDAKAIQYVEAITETPLSFGSAVQLDKLTAGADKYPFGFKANGTIAATVDGIIMKGLMYGADGKTLPGKGVQVITKGLVCVAIDTSLAGCTFGEDVNYDGGKFKATGGKKVGTVASNVFKAQSTENDKLVDAIYINVDPANA